MRLKFSKSMQQKGLALVLTGLFVGTILSAGISFQLLHNDNVKNESSFMNISSWALTEIDNMTWGSMGGETYESAVVVDSSGGVHVSYISHPGYDLKYAHFDGNTWNTTVVDYANGSSTGVDEGLSIDLDSNGFVHIAYPVYGKGLKYATNAVNWSQTINQSQYNFQQLSGWISFQLSSGSISDTSLKIDSNDHANLMFSDTGGTNSGLKYYYDLDITTPFSSWNQYFVEEEVYKVSLELDANDNPHFAYVVFDNDLNYANNNNQTTSNSNWNNSLFTKNLDNLDLNLISTALDRNLTMNVVVNDGTTEELSYYRGSGNNWSSFIVKEGVSHSKIALKSGDIPTIVYRNSGGLNLTMYDVANNSWAEINLASGTIKAHDIFIDEFDNTYITFVENGILKILTHRAPAPPSPVMPSITELSNWTISPNTGTSEGGTDLTISGSDFTSLLGENIVIDSGEDINRIWNDYTVDTGTGTQNYTGMFTSSAIDDQGGIHVAYYDDGEGKIMYAYNYGGTSWSKHPVDSIGSGATVGISTSIQVDSEGGIHISYSGWDTYDLKYAYNISETHYNQKNWNIVTVDSTGDLGYHSSLALDSNGFVHIAYEDFTHVGTWGGKLKYANNINGNWKSEYTNLPYGSGLYNSIALDSEDRIYISSFNSINNSLMLVTNLSSTGPQSQNSNWESYLISNSPSAWTSIAIDSTDNIHLSYFDGSNESLVYAASTPSFPCINAGDCWSFETIDDRQTGGVGYFSSIAIDSKDKVHISYLDDLPNEDLKYATNENGIWEFTTIDGNTFGYNIGDYCSLSIDRNDNIHISYWDYTNNDLKYATSTIIPSTYWTNEVVDSSSNVGWWNSISTDSSGKTHVAYADMTSGDLKYAEKDNNSWTTSVVETNSFSTWQQGLLYPSMEVDSNGAVHIVYFDAGNKAINYAKLEPNNASFVIETILSESYYTAGSGYLSLALDSNNIPHLSMTIITASASNHQYKYASKHNGTWIDGTIDFCPTSCGHSYIDVDSSNRPHVATLTM